MSPEPFGGFLPYCNVIFTFFLLLLSGLNRLLTSGMYTAIKGKGGKRRWKRL
jgi:hypothetical protein